MALSLEVKNAVTHLQSHAQTMRAVITIADEVKKVADLEQVAQEAVNRRDEAEEDLKRLTKKIDDGKATLISLKEADEEGKNLIYKAGLEAEKITKAAEESAAALLLKAEDEAKLIVSAADQRRAAVTAGLDSEIASRKAEIETLDTSISVKESEAKELDDRAERARRYLARLTEG